MLKTFTSQIAWAIVVFLQVGGSSAFWRLLCDGSVGLARIDPLTDMGGVSNHVHSIKGGSGEFRDSLRRALNLVFCININKRLPETSTVFVV